MVYPRVVTLVLVVGLLAPVVFSLPPGGASLAAIPVRQADSGNPVELTWVALRPQDATEPGYLRDGATDLTLNLIGSFTYEAGPEQDALEAAMGEAGWRDGYYVTLRRPKAEDAESVGQIVSSVIYQFADEAGAAQGFGRLGGPGHIGGERGRNGRERSGRGPNRGQDRTVPVPPSALPLGRVGRDRHDLGLRREAGS